MATLAFAHTSGPSRWPAAGDESASATIEDLKRTAPTLVSVSASAPTSETYSLK